MLTGPVDVTKKLLARAGMSIKDIDLFEVNEAFASVVLRYLQAFDLDPAKVNRAAARSPWAIRSARPARCSSPPRSTNWSALASRRRSSPSASAGMGTATIIERV